MKSLPLPSIQDYGADLAIFYALSTNMCMIICTSVYVIKGYIEYNENFVHQTPLLHPLSVPSKHESAGRRFSRCHVLVGLASAIGRFLSLMTLSIVRFFPDALSDRIVIALLLFPSIFMDLLTVVSTRNLQFYLKAHIVHATNGQLLPNSLFDLLILMRIQLLQSTKSSILFYTDYVAGINGVISLFLLSIQILLFLFSLSWTRLWIYGLNVALLNAVLMICVLIYICFVCSEAFLRMGNAEVNVTESIRSRIAVLYVSNIMRVMSTIIILRWGDGQETGEIGFNNLSVYILSDMLVLLLQSWQFFSASALVSFTCATGQLGSDDSFESIIDRSSSSPIHTDIKTTCMPLHNGSLNRIESMVIHYATVLDIESAGRLLLVCYTSVPTGELKSSFVRRHYLDVKLSPVTVVQMQKSMQSYYLNLLPNQRAVLLPFERLIWIDELSELWILYECPSSTWFPFLYSYYYLQPRYGEKVLAWEAMVKSFVNNVAEVATLEINNEKKKDLRGGHGQIDVYVSVLWNVETGRNMSLPDVRLIDWGLDCFLPFLEFPVSSFDTSDEISTLSSHLRKRNFNLNYITCSEWVQNLKERLWGRSIEWASPEIIDGVMYRVCKKSLSLRYSRDSYCIGLVLWSLATMNGISDEFPSPYGGIEFEDEFYEQVALRSMRPAQSSLKNCRGPYGSDELQLVVRTCFVHDLTRPHPWTVREAMQSIWYPENPYENEKPRLWVQDSVMLQETHLDVRRD